MTVAKWMRRRAATPYGPIPDLTRPGVFAKVNESKELLLAGWREIVVMNKASYMRIDRLWCAKLIQEAVCRASGYNPVSGRVMLLHP